MSQLLRFTTPGQLIKRFVVPTMAMWVAILMLGSQAIAQDKKALDHSDYDRWNNLGATQLSNDGKWVSYSITSAKKDSESTLFVRRNGTAKQYEIPRGSGARFTFDSKYLVYRVTPAKSRIEELKRAKVKTEELPGPRMEVLELATGNKTTADKVSSFSMPRENGRWLGYIRPETKEEKLAQSNAQVNETLKVTESGLERIEKKPKLKPRRENEFKMPKPKGKQSGKKTEAAKKEADSKQPGADEKEKPSHKKKSTGQVFVLHDLESGLQRSYPHVVRFSFDKHGTRVALVTSMVADTSKLKQLSGKGESGKATGADKDANPQDGVHVIDLKDLALKTIQSGVGEYKSLAFNEDGSRLAWLTNQDDYLTKTPSWSVYHWKSGLKEGELAVAEATAGLPEGWWISPNTRLTYSEDNKRFYFDTAPVPEDVMKERKDAAARKAGQPPAKEEAKAKLDLWHWQDPQLQPQQLLRAGVERNRSYRAAFNLKSKKAIQLATKEIPSIRIDTRSKSDLAVAATEMPYRKMMSWDIQGYQDTYVVDLNTGARTKLIQRGRASGQLSPEGKFVTWYDPEDRHWYATPSTGEADRQPVKISEGITYPLYNELHDTPSLPGSYGSPGWQTDDAAMFVYDRYDIWKLDPTGNQKPVCVTQEYGRQNKIRLRALRLDLEARAVDVAEPVYLSAFDENSKATGFYKLHLQPKPESVGKTSNEAEEKNQQPLTRLVMADESFGRLTKARNSDDVMFTRSTFRMFPDVWTSSLKFDRIYRITDANPQQKNYRWGTAELVQWKATDGQDLEGLLYKPDGFDASQKYPLMVYFYERNSDNLHRYYAPAAGRSIINFSFYASRGYLIFVPDIPYRTGEPGPSAANAILPGVEYLIDQGFVDQDKVGMQGHSWGGYQTAYLVTQTDMFACAESGAPVSNMTSAYGGIRWSSGMSRMFQYEKTQSRIGGDLWSAREKYIANSPVFFADKINTPLLILHNDQDGAVPWYQGIELFVALRRLEKPAWLLNYNGDPHWVMGDANRMDFAKRMQQFFDHYLMDAPEPEWMAYGIPAVDKGKAFGFDLLEPKQNNSTKEATASESK